MWEKAEEYGVDTVGDRCQVGFAIEEVKVVHFHGEHLAGVFLVDELVVEAVEVFQVVKLHLLLIAATALLDVLHQVGNGGAEVNHQVGHMDGRHHRLKQFHIAFVIALVEIAHRVVVGREDMHAFEDAAVLDHRLPGVGDVEDVLEALLEEIHLEGERPPRDVLVVVLQIGVVLHSLKLGNPSIVLGEEFRERGLPTTDVACDDDMHVSPFFIGVKRELKGS